MSAGKEPGKGRGDGQPPDSVDFAEPGKSASIRHLTEEEQTRQPKNDLRWIREAAHYMSAAGTLTGGVVLGLLGGMWLDRKLDTNPWLTLAGLLLGVGIGLYEVAQVALKKQGTRD